MHESDRDSDLTQPYDPWAPSVATPAATPAADPTPAPDDGPDGPLSTLPPGPDEPTPAFAPGFAPPFSPAPVEPVQPAPGGFAPRNGGSAGSGGVRTVITAAVLSAVL